MHKRDVGASRGMPRPRGGSKCGTKKAYKFATTTAEVYRNWDQVQIGNRTLIYYNISPTQALLNKIQEKEHKEESSTQQNGCRQMARIRSIRIVKNKQKTSVGDTTSLKHKTNVFQKKQRNQAATIRTHRGLINLCGVKGGENRQQK